MADLNIFVTELNNDNEYFYQTDILKQFLSGYVLHRSLRKLLLEHNNFLNIDISQGSVATCLWWCGILK